MNDAVNGIFELLGGVILLLNCRRMYIDKQLRGVSILPTVFFTSWGFWNLFYYPSLNQTLSFCGGLSIAVGNILMLSMMLYYRDA